VPIGIDPLPVVEPSVSVRFFTAPVIRFLRPDGTESRTTAFDRPVFETWTYVDENGTERPYDVPVPVYSFPRSYAYVESDGEPVLALVRCEVPDGVEVAAGDFVEEVTSPEAFASLIAAEPALAARFEDSPDIASVKESPVEVVKS
jgi:hypothetical protein